MPAGYKDKDTGQHTRRIGNLSAATAKLLHLSDKEVETILNVDKDEWDIMRHDTTIGAKILTGSDVDFINLAHIVVMTHHENDPRHH